MKRFFLSILLISGIAVGLTACSSGAYNANPNGTSNGINPLWVPPGINVSSNSTDYFKAKINGVSYSAPNIITATYDTIQYIYGLTPANGSYTQQFTLGLINYGSINPGTYALPNSNISLQYYAVPPTTTTDLINMTTVTGSVVITSKTANSISGTFIISLYDSVQITGGSFGASW